MCNRLATRHIRTRSLLIDMIPVVIKRRRGKAVDHLLRHHQPRTWLELKVDISRIIRESFQFDHRQPPLLRSEEHTSELQSLMRISYAVFCLKKKKKNQ